MLGHIAISALQTVSLPNMCLLRPIYQSNLPKELLYGTNKTKVCIAIDPSNMQFLYFLKAMDDMRYPENGWWENDYLASASASFRKKKRCKTPSAGFRNCRPVPFSKFHDTILHIIMSKINDAAQLTPHWTPHYTYTQRINTTVHSTLHSTLLTTVGEIFLMILAVDFFWTSARLFF